MSCHPRVTEWTLIIQTHWPTTQASGRARHGPTVLEVLGLVVAGATLWLLCVGGVARAGAVARRALRARTFSGGGPHAAPLHHIACGAHRHPRGHGLGGHGPRLRQSSPHMPEQRRASTRGSPRRPRIPHTPMPHRPCTPGSTLPRGRHARSSANGTPTNANCGPIVPRWLPQPCASVSLPNWHANTPRQPASAPRNMRPRLRPAGYRHHDWKRVPCRRLPDPNRQCASHVIMPPSQRAPSDAHRTDHGPARGAQGYLHPRYGPVHQ